MAELHPFWADDFDMDLLRVLPDLPQLVGDLGAVNLYTYGGTHPAVRSNQRGEMDAFFGTNRDAESWMPAACVSGHQELVECTWLEVLRDVWVHQCHVHVDMELVWNTNRLARLFNDLMFGRRGHRPISGAMSSGMETVLRGEVVVATERLRLVLAEGTSTDD